MGISRAGARLPKSLSEATQELLFLSREREGGSVEAPLRTPRASAGGAFSGRIVVHTPRTFLSLSEKHVQTVEEILNLPRDKASMSS
jgi:hypothetical protein